MPLLPRKAFKKRFPSLGVPENLPYHQMMTIIKADFRLFPDRYEALPEYSPFYPGADKAAVQATLKDYKNLATYTFNGDIDQFCLRYFESFPKASKILSLGCGYAHELEYLYAIGHDVVGIDLDFNVLKEADERIKADVQQNKLVEFGFDQRRFSHSPPQFVCLDLSNQENEEEVRFWCQQNTVLIAKRTLHYCIDMSTPPFRTGLDLLDTYLKIVAEPQSTITHALFVFQEVKMSNFKIYIPNKILPQPGSFPFTDVRSMFEEIFPNWDMGLQVQGRKSDDKSTTTFVYAISITKKN